MTKRNFLKKINSLTKLHYKNSNLDETNNKTINADKLRTKLNKISNIIKNIKL